MTDPFRDIDMAPAGSRLPAGPVQRVEVRGRSVIAHFESDSVDLNPDWLRDHCPCESCRIAQTDERRWQPWLDTEPACVAGATMTADGLAIAWASGHDSLYSASTLEAIDRAAHRGAYTARLWSAGYTIERFDHGESIADLITRRRLFEAFRRDGAIVVTGSPTSPGTVIDYLRTLGITVRDSSLGLIFDVKLDPAGYNVAFTAENVPPHNDNAQYSHPPSGQVLAMLVNEATGGHNSVVDGWAVLDELDRADPAAIEVLSRVEVGFRQYSREVEAFWRSPLVVRDSAGRFTHLRFSNALMQPLPYDHPDLAEWYRAYRLLGAAVTDRANQVSFRLEAGDMLFVNGYRVLHARAEFQPDGARHLQDVYFDVDDIHGHLARMTGEASDAMVPASAMSLDSGRGQ